MTSTDEEVKRLLSEIAAKLEAHRPEIAKSIAFGRIVWRSKNGRIDISLELKV